jgi:hypothetical protein
VVYGHVRAEPTRGIGSSCPVEPGGEVTAREVDGGMLAWLGVASVGMATVQAAWGVAGVRLRGGVVEGGLQGGARSLGVDGGGVVVKTEGEGDPGRV